MTGVPRRSSWASPPRSLAVPGRHPAGLVPAGLYLLGRITGRRDGARVGRAGGGRASAIVIARLVGDEGMPGPDLLASSAVSKCSGYRAHRGQCSWPWRWRPAPVRARGEGREGVLGATVAGGDVLECAARSPIRGRMMTPQADAELAALVEALQPRSARRGPRAPGSSRRSPKPGPASRDRRDPARHHRSPAELQPVLEAVAASAARLCESIDPPSTVRRRPARAGRPPRGDARRHPGRVLPALVRGTARAARCWTG